MRARVVELVDTRDLKSLEGNFVTVRVRPRAPFKDNLFLLYNYENKCGWNEIYGASLWCMFIGFWV